MSGITHNQAPVKPVLLRDQRRMTIIAVAAVAALLSALFVFLDGGDTPQVARQSAVSQVVSSSPQPSVRYDGGPEEGSRGIATNPPTQVRYDGGPEEGSRGIARDPLTHVRFDGGPEEGTRGPGH